MSKGATSWVTRACLSCGRAFRIRYEYKGKANCPYGCKVSVIMRRTGRMTMKKAN